MTPVVVCLYVFEGMNTLDVSGPAEVFHSAGGYQVQLVSHDGRPVRGASGVSCNADASLAEIVARPPGSVDTFLVVGGEGTPAVATDPTVLRGLAALDGRVRRLGSVCSGAFVLAAAGLLDGRRVATHWSVCEQLARLFPDVAVEPDALYVHDGPRWSSAGVSAGIDMALAMVADDRSPEAALAVARHLVVFMHRSGGQSQFSAHLEAQAARSRPVADAQTWALEHLDDDLSVESLARRAHLSPRQFARVFRAEVGQPPGRWVEQARIDAARRMLGDGLAVSSVARECGFGTDETLRRAFHRIVGVSPSAYRDRFHLTHRESS